MADTIIALSSGGLPSGVAVVRISGPLASDVVALLVGALPNPREATLKLLKSTEGDVIDEAIVLWFPGPGSFTGEDVAEFHLHGGKAVVARLLDLATDIDGIRLAEAGEFTQRAFANGKMDLTEAEGLADLIDAETESQRKIAQYLVGGGLKDLYDDWQEQLLNARASIEADIDFADEDDVPGSVADQVWDDMNQLKQAIDAHLASFGSAERIRDGFRISLIGNPNVGKSSLLNALAGSDRAIVSDEAGTTRDVVEVRLDLGGYLVLIADTAGLREGAGAVESEGIKRSLLAAKSSDLVLHLSDVGQWPDLDGVSEQDLMRVHTKVDLLDFAPELDNDAVGVCVTNMSSLSSFVEVLTKKIESSFDNGIANNAIKSRYLDHLKNCSRDIELAVNDQSALEIRVEALRRAAFSLGRITGQTDTEDVLGRIFSSFCIGK
ncbi:MAG: tRNA uridine-5-carboxymethylaminomethyl(34) synthesis GTPase MnmE [Pseudomonadota bacterium]